MSVKIVGPKKALALLKKQVKKNGEDFIYSKVNDGYGNPGCVYFDPRTKSPSCIVGHVLADLGVTFDELDSYDLNSDTDVASLVVEEFLAISPATMKVLAAAQVAQDTGRTWGDALKEAEKVAR